MSKLWDIVKTVGATALNVAVPGAGTAIVDGINELLPDGKKLPANATGHDAMNAITSLPPEQQAAIKEKEFEVELASIHESGATLRAAIDADVNNPQTTRPYIAKGSFQVVAFAICSVVAIFCFGVAMNRPVMVKAITNGWPFILSVISPLVVLLRAYFGVLREEHKNKLAAASGNHDALGLSGLSGAVTNIIKAVKGG